MSVVWRQAVRASPGPCQARADPDRVNQGGGSALLAAAVRDSLDAGVPSGYGRLGAFAFCEASELLAW